MKTLPLNAGSILVWLIGLSACSTSPPHVPDASLENTTPDGLVRVENSRFDEVYVRPGFDLARFSTVMLAPVSVSYKSRRPENELSEHQVDLMRRYFCDALEAAFTETGKFTLVEAAGDGTIIVRAEIADLEVNVPTDVAPIRRNVVFVASSGEMTLVAELYDGGTRDLLARLKDRRQARQYWHRATAVSEWNDVRSAFHYWAGIARDRIEAAHANKLQQ